MKKFWSPIDRIVLVNDGQIVADEPTNQLLHENSLEKLAFVSFI